MEEEEEELEWKGWRKEEKRIGEGRGVGMKGKKEGREMKDRRRKRRMERKGRRR